ncbi:MAG: response regulator [Methanobacteriota archaeon]|nr:MAG: response regulator [Euryarchaeota archaeon]
MATIMLVDDDKMLRLIYRVILEQEGYQVIEAESGLECLKILGEGEKPDLILMDVIMPDLDGWKTCKRIKENPETKDIVVAMLTVLDQPADEVRSLKSFGADWHISKRMNKTLILETVKWLLSSQKSKKEKPKSIIEIK